MLSEGFSLFRGLPQLVPAGIIGLLLAAGPARAQTDSARDEPSAEQRRGAAEAYNRGSAAYLAGDFAQAATWFETAHRLAPASPALVQAVRAYDRAGNALRAATLSLRLETLYPDDPDASETARRVLDASSSRFFRVDVVCDACHVELDGTLLEHPSFFVEPGTEHDVGAHFDTGDVSERVVGEAGERREVAFEAPPPSPDAPPTTLPDTAAGGGAEPHGLPPFVLIAGAVLTAGAVGALVWSGVDTLSGVDAYEADPTTEALAEGQAKEIRTNVLIGVTAAFAVATGVIALFTNFGGGSEDLRAAIGPLPGGAAAFVEGRL